MISLNLEQIKRIELEIMDVIDDFANKNGLCYTLAGGTLIGAVRHQGFIPWDDDIDIFMPRADYEIFLELFNMYSDRYRALTAENTDNYPYPFCKVIDTKTVLVEHKYKQYQGGVFVDIFPVDYVGNDFESVIKLNKKIWVYRSLLDWKMQRLSWKRGFKKLRLILEKIIAFPFDRVWLNKRIQILCKIINESESKYIANICVFTYGQNEIVLAEDFCNYIRMPFEGRYYNVAVGYDRILTNLFGDYMKLPPIEMRVTHHDFSAWKEE